MSEHEISARDLELAEQALKFAFALPPVGPPLRAGLEDRKENIALLFALSRQEGRLAGIDEIKVRLFETPLSRDFSP